MHGPLTDEALMLAYCRGDRAAFDALFHRYAALILRLGRRHLGSEDAAEELVQQTFLRLHGARHDYQSDNRLHPWLMTIVMNGVRDQWRRRRRKPTAPLQHEPTAPPSDPTRRLERRHDADELYKALAQLPKGQREVIELHWFQELPFADVARVLGIREGSARVRAHRAYARLRERLVPQAAAEGGK